MAAVSCCFFCSSIVSVLFFPSVILLDNGLIKAEMTPYLTHTFSDSYKVQCSLFLCSWLTCGIAVAWLWPRSGEQERSVQVPLFHATCGPDHHSTCAGSGPTLCCYLGLPSGRCMIEALSNLMICWSSTDWLCLVCSIRVLTIWFKLQLFSEHVYQEQMRLIAHCYVIYGAQAVDEWLGIRSTAAWSTTDYRGKHK